MQAFEILVKCSKSWAQIIRVIERSGSVSFAIRPSCAVEMHSKGCIFFQNGSYFATWFSFPSIQELSFPTIAAESGRDGMHFHVLRCRVTKRFFIRQVHNKRLCFWQWKYLIFSWGVKLSRFESMQIQILPKPKAARCRSHSSSRSMLFLACVCWEQKPNETLESDRIRIWDFFF